MDGQRAEQIDHQVRIGVWQGGIRGAEQLKNWRCKQQAGCHQHQSAGAQQVNEVFMSDPGFFGISAAAAD